MAVAADVIQPPHERAVSQSMHWSNWTVSVQTTSSHVSFSAKKKKLFSFFFVLNETKHLMARTCNVWRHPHKIMVYRATAAALEAQPRRGKSRVPATKRFNAVEELIPPLICRHTHT